MQRGSRQTNRCPYRRADGRHCRYTNSPKREFIGLLVGSDNNSDICIEGIKTKVLIDTGSHSTIAEDFLLSLDPAPTVYNVEYLGLKVNVANGQTLNYLGCVVIHASVPHFGKDAVLVPCLVVSMTAYNNEVPVIVSNNIINRVYQGTREGADIPTE